MKVRSPSDAVTLAKAIRSFLSHDDHHSRRACSMKALLLKDFLTLAKMIRTILIIMLIVACIPQLNMSVFFMVYCAMLPISALGYDERTKWDVQAAMMPYRPREIVLGKYVLGYLILTVATVLALLAKIIVGSVTGSTITADQYLMVAAYALAVTFFLSITLPLVFRFGVEKGRLAMGIGLGVGFGVLVALIPLLSDNMDAIMLTKVQVVLLVLAVTIVVNLISIRLSTAIYQRKRA